MKIITTAFFSFFLIISNYSYGNKAGIEQGSIFIELENALFPKSTSSMDLSDLCIGEISFKYEIPDVQPDVDRATVILKDLLYVIDSVNIGRVEQLGNRYSMKMSNIWDDYFSKGGSLCPEIKRQLSILSAFELILTGFDMKKLTPANKYEYFKNQTKKYAFDNLKVEEFSLLLDNIKLRIKRTDILKFRSFRIPTSFSCVDPYLEELNPFFVNDFKQFTFSQNKNKANSDEAYFIIDNINYISSINDSEIDEVIPLKFQNYYENNRLIWLYRLIGQRNNSKNLKLALEELIYNVRFPKEKFKTDFRDYYFRSLFYHPDNKVVIQEHLFAIYNSATVSEYKLECLKYFVYFPNRKVIKLIRREKAKLSKEDENKKSYDDLLKLLISKRN